MRHAPVVIAVLMFLLAPSLLPAEESGERIDYLTFAQGAPCRSASRARAPVSGQGLSSDRSASITIEGHTSSEGTNDYNQSLSERRAQAIVADLVKRGIDAKRLKAAGLGETRPISPNTDESGRALNRRVEVKCQ